MSGRVLYSMPIQSYDTKEVSTIASGCYFISLKQGATIIKTTSYIKQH